ncbi:MAG: FKBP-type peptidyl-prolyl cis-trans isomerase [Candidatus Saccharibacteria bacterium]|nr:FKBP-type peptidyl-prolyl cis-trans isomerase [Candidatus Saccharibacteria bacterium]
MGSFKDWRKRIIAISAAVLFLATSVGFSLMVIWQIKRDNDQNKQQQELQSALDQAQTENTNASEANEATESTNQTSEETTKLEGTKLSGFTPVASVTQLQITDTVAGTGAEVKAGDTITAHYTGALAKDGTIFQSSLDTGNPFTSPLANLIQGWQTGIPGMKEGGTRRLVIPAAQAYGSTERPGIPANSDLVFDIQLIKIGE